MTFSKLLLAGRMGDFPDCFDRAESRFRHFKVFRDNADYHLVLKLDISRDSELQSVAMFSREVVS